MYKSSKTNEDASCCILRINKKDEDEGDIQGKKINNSETSTEITNQSPNPTKITNQSPNPTKMKNQVNFELEAPDGGWGWMILLGCFVIHVLLPMLPAFFGFLFPNLKKELKLSSTTIAWIYNTGAFIWNFAGFIAGPLCNEFEWRTVALIGSFLASMSVFITSFATSSVFIFFSFSFLCGIGGGLAFSVCHLSLPHYFNKKRGLAMGIVMAGISVGQFILPLLINHLHNTYGYKYSTLIFGALLLNSCVGAALFHPIKWHAKKIPAMELREMIDKSVSKPLISVTKDNCDNILSSDAEDDNLNCTSTDNFNNYSSKQNLFKICLLKIYVIKTIVSNIIASSIRNLIFLKNPKALVLSLSAGCVMSGYLNFILMLPYTVKYKGYELEVAAYCISSLAVANFVGRILIPVLTAISSKPVFVCLYQIIGQVIICSSIFAFCIVGDLFMMILCLCCLGFGIGISTGLYTLVMIAVVGLECLPLMFGAVSLVSGLIFISIGPLAGWLQDYFDSYEVANQFLSLIVLFGVSLWILMPFIFRREKQKKCKEVRRKIINDFTQFATQFATRGIF